MKFLATDVSLNFEEFFGQAVIFINRTQQPILNFQQKSLHLSRAKIVATSDFEKELLSNPRCV